MFEEHEANFISYHGIVSKLLNLKTKITPGPDNLPNVFLRRYAETIAKFLVVLFRASLLCAKFPEDWKMARVVPVFKKGNRLLLENYRPISLTSSWCKLFEHIITTRITEFLDEHSILSIAQHGFRKGCSTTTQLVTIIDSIAKALDANGQIDAVFLDFSKAFDRVIHKKLILKLRNINLPDIIIAWITDYLDNRQQYVSVDDHNSGYICRSLQVFPRAVSWVHCSFFYILMTLLPSSNLEHK